MRNNKYPILLDYSKERYEFKKKNKEFKFSNNSLADELITNLKEYPHAYVLGCCMDRQDKSERCWLIPYKIKEIIGSFKIEDLGRLKREEYIDIFDKNNLHRFKKDMGSVFYDAVHLILNKYKGDALWQKGYISDFLQKTRKENKGEIPQYYVEEHHEAIIQPEQFDYIQAEIARRENDGRGSGLTIFSNKIKCGKCGAWYGLKTWHSNDEYRREIYRCNDKYKTKGKPCKSPHLTEAEIKDIFVKALNSMSKVKKTVINEVYDFIDTICATTEIEIEMTRLEQELNNIISDMESLIRKNARTVQKQEEYLQKENKIREKYSEVNSRLTELENQIKIKQNRKTMLENFIKTLDGIEGAITKFDNDLWSGLIDYILVKDIERYAVVFKNGMAIDI